MISTVMVLLIVVCFVVIVLPICAFLYLFYLSKRPQHSIIRAHPYLGWLRYFLEKLGPEFRQYWFDGDTSGRPFSRADFLAVVFASKYRTDLISFGSKRDYEQPGMYLANSLFPKLVEELEVDTESMADVRKYEVLHEGLFTRREHMRQERAKRWLYRDEDAVLVGPDRPHPWHLRGMFGGSATSYGAVGEHYIKATGNGARMAGGSWINTGEGGVAPDHLATGADIVAQIGPGLFGYRDDDGNFSDEAFRNMAETEQIRAFELKFHQGAKIRGGHLEGTKVNQKIAEIRKVPVGKTVNSPNRFPFLKNARDALRFVEHLQRIGGKPIGIKMVVGDGEQLDEWFQTMKALDVYPDFLTVDGSEGGSGATFKAMADGMGLPLYSALVLLDDAARKYEVRDRIRIFASGKLITPDKVAIALALGADAVNSARGFMMASGCIMAMQCHTGKCPTGITTTNPKYQAALAPDEKQWRVMNYILQMREGVYALAAATGLESPQQFRREHVVFKDASGKALRMSDIFPYPNTISSDGVQTTAH